MIPKVMTGARAILKIKGGAGQPPRMVAMATNVGYRVAIPHSPINVLGRYTAAGFEPLGMDVTVNCGVLRFPKSGGSGNSPASTAQGIQPKLQEIMTFEDLQIEIIDRKTNDTIALVARARLTDRGGNMGARDLLAENWTFVGVLLESSDAPEQEEASPAGHEGPNVEAAENV